MCSDGAFVVLGIEEYQLAGQAGRIWFRSMTVVVDNSERAVSSGVVQIFLTSTTHSGWAVVEIRLVNGKEPKV